MKCTSRHVLVVTALAVMATVSCNKNSSTNTNPNATQPTVVVPPPVTPAAKRYHLKGRVVSVDKQAKMVNVDSDAIADFMDAMTMPYQVKPESQMDKLSPGDAITAELVVQDEKAWLENIAVTGHSAAPAPK